MPPRLPPAVRVLGTEEILSLARSAEPIDYADTAADDPAFLIYTSGTVGRPKGVLHGHRTAWGRRPMYQGWYGITERDVILRAGAFNWTYTLGVGLIDPWANGATAVLHNGPSDPAVWPELIARFSVTIFATVPSLYRRILKYGAFDRERLTTLRHGLTAGEALPPAVLEAWRREVHFSPLLLLAGSDVDAGSPRSDQTATPAAQSSDRHNPARHQPDHQPAQPDQAR